MATFRWYVPLCPGLGLHEQQLSLRCPAISLEVDDAGTMLRSSVNEEVKRGWIDGRKG